MKKSLIQKLGLLGIVSFLSYTAAVIFAPLAYPGYNWMAQAVGDRMFPLSDSGYARAFQDVMHMVVTVLAVLLSIASLTVIIAAGIKSENCRSYGVCAAIALAMMLVGAMGMKIVPAGYFGVVERFSVFAATGFNAALGIHLFCSRAM